MFDRNLINKLREIDSSENKFRFIVVLPCPKPCHAVESLIRSVLIVVIQCLQSLSVKRLLSAAPTDLVNRFIKSSNKTVLGIRKNQDRQQ